MTAPAVLDPAEVATRPYPSAAVGRALVLGLAVAGPVLLLIGGVVAPDLSGSNATVLAHVPPVADRLLTAHLLNTAGSLAYVATIVTTLRIPVRQGAALRLIGGAIAILGLLSNALGETLDGYAAWAGARAHVPVAAQARLFDVLDASPAALPVSWLAIPVLALGGVVLWVGVLRAHRTVPIWAPIIAILGTLVVASIGGSGPIQLLGAIGTVGSVATALYAARSARS